MPTFIYYHGVRTSSDSVVWRLNILLGLLYLDGSVWLGQFSVQAKQRQTMVKEEQDVVHANEGYLSRGKS